MNQRTLQNCKVYYLNTKSERHSNTIYASHTDYSLNSQDLPFFHQRDCDKLDGLFNDGSNIVILTAQSGMGKSHTLRQYAANNSCNFGAVILTAFDKNRYIFTEDSPELSDDFIIKKCITRIFYDKEFYSKRFSDNYFLNDSPEDILYSLASKNTLIILDDFDLTYIPDFIYSLCGKGFKILLSSKSAPCVGKSELFKVSHLTLENTCADDIKKYCDVDDGFVKEFGCNLLAARFAQNYQKLHPHFNGSITDLLKGIAKKQGIDLKIGFVKAFFTLFDFSENCKELLRSLCLLLFYAPQHLYISDEESICFSLNDACRYTGSKNSSFRPLISSGFINTTCDGLLYADSAVTDFVFSYMKPSAENCPCLTKLITRNLSFKLSHFHKEIFGQVYAEKGEKYMEASDIYNLMDTLSYFAKNGGLKSPVIYNALSVYTLSCLAEGTEHRYTLHLMLRNVRVLFDGFRKVITSDAFQYTQRGDTTRELYSEAYTKDIFANLDIIRICIAFLRFSHTLQYEELSYIFGYLSQAFSYITYCGKNSSCSFIEVYYNVIELCRETFFHFNDISSNGFANSSRCNEKSIIGYTDNVYWNDKNACSLFPLYSPSVLRLYGDFHKITKLFCAEYKKCGTKAYVTFPKASCNAIERFNKEFSSFLNRLKTGFGVFLQFYSKKYTSSDAQSILSALDDKELGLLIESARHYRKSFYDGDTQIISQRYAKQIFDTVRTCHNPAIYVLLATDCNFPVSQRCIDALKKLNFCDLICEKCSKNSLFAIYEHCTSQIYKCPDRFDFYAEIITKIRDKTTLSENAASTGIRHISYALIVHVCELLKDYLKTDYSRFAASKIFPLLDCEKVMHLYQEVTQNQSTPLCSEQYIAASVVRLLKNRSISVTSGAKMSDSLMSIIYELLPNDNYLSRLGFAFLISHLVQKNDAVGIIGEMLDLDMSLKISPESAKRIKDFISRRK